MKHLNDAAFRIAQEIENHHPNLWRQDHVDHVCLHLVMSGYESQPAMYAALTQVAKLESLSSSAFFDLKISTPNVVFIRDPKMEKPQAIFLRDIIRNLITDQGVE